MTLCSPTLQESTNNVLTSEKPDDNRENMIQECELNSEEETSKNNKTDSSILHENHVESVIISDNNAEILGKCDQECEKEILEKKSDTLPIEETSSKKNKKFTFDSDSDTEPIQHINQSLEINSEDDEPKLLTKKKRSRIALMNSDSEDETEVTTSHSKCQSVDQEGISESVEENLITSTIGSNSDNENDASSTFIKKKRHRIALIDSDSEDEIQAVSDQVCDSNKVLEYESVGQKDSTKEEDGEKEKRIFSSLCDPESSDENNSEKEGDISESELDALKSNAVIPKSRKGKAQRNTEDKVEKMTAKKALEQRKEILAESQRRVRESRVSLPYHKPKPKSLKEFLQNRSKLSDPLRNVSSSTSPAASLKMSMQQLKIITQKIKEREKEVEEFYKSASESENEDEETVMNDNDTATTNVATAPLPNIDTSTTSRDTTEISGVPNSETPVVINADTHVVPAVLHIETSPDVSPLSVLNLDTPATNVGNTSASNVGTPALENGITSLTSDADDPVVTNGVFQSVSKAEDNLDVDLMNIEYEKTTEEIEIPDKSENATNELAGSAKTGISPMDCEITENGTKPEMKENTDTSVDIHRNTDEIADDHCSKITENTPALESNENRKEEVSEKTSNIVLISDLLLLPTKSNENKYNIDAELLELATEAEKVDEDPCDDYEFNLDDIEDEFDGTSENREIVKKDDKVSNVSKRRSAILEKLGELKPRLSVGPNQIIDLENGIAMPDEISQLKEKFMQHNLKPEKHSHKKEMSIMNVTDGQIHKETLILKLDDMEDEDMKPLEKPGVRMQKLREELQHQMAQRRSDLWREKLTKKNDPEKMDEDNGDEEKPECAKDILDNEDEEDFTDPEEDEDDVEEENYREPKEKPQKKSHYVDDEAEESDVDPEESDDEGDIEENDEDQTEGSHETYEEKTPSLNSCGSDEDIEPKKKVLKRIIRPTDEDSEDEMVVDQAIDAIVSDDSLITPQPANFKTREPLISPQKSDDHFATPVTYMTGIKNLNTSGLKFLAPENTFEADKESQTEPKSSTSSAETQETESQNDCDSNSFSTQDVHDICSGQFGNTQKCMSSPEISTQQLREVFTGSMKSSTFNTQDVNDICSGGFTGVSQATQEKQAVLDQNDDHLISQLIDEDELENFKKKFESPGSNTAAANARKPPFEVADEVVGTGGVIDSDDEDEDGLKLNNKKRKRLAFSDDEDSSMSDIPQEETIDLQDDDDLRSNVDYDSEENEVDGNAEEGTEESKKEKLKASDFFENEAELSESEWGSEDEDERNLDDLEFEKGDNEKFDEDELRTDIEKLQMKQMLDEDNREVKMLQELLLEDGELHGSGRQRQFRWKNIDSGVDDAEERKDDEDEVYIEEDESEEQYRKERHRREMLKLKQQSQESEDSLVMESQTLSFTHRSLKIKSQNSLSSQISTSEVESSPKVKQPFTLLNKRGSFLSRGEKILQKIAETSKVSFTSKNTNRIVFQTIDEDSKKRKASSAELENTTPVALKKLRLSGLSPGLNKERPKAKSLFEKILQD